MGYVRYKLPEQTHDMLRKVTDRFGMKESEVSRIAVMEYLKSIGVLSERVRKISISEKIDHLRHKEEDEHEHRSRLLLGLRRLRKDRENKGKQH